MVQRLFLSVFITIVSLPVSAQETFPVNGTHNESHIYYYFTNATVHVDYETIIEMTGNLIRERRIYMVPAPGCNKTLRLEVFKNRKSANTSFKHDLMIQGQCKRHQN